MFQSTFPRGERQYCSEPRHAHNRRFNPRSHEGNDGYTEDNATSIAGFQSTFPRGERRTSLIIIYRMRSFQSTFPRGERRSVISGNVNPCCFNPRSHEGNDGVSEADHSFLYSVSIHVPTRGTTLFFDFEFTWYAVSIHVPTRGTTTCNAPNVGYSQFQSTFPRGERRWQECNSIQL